MSGQLSPNVISEISHHFTNTAVAAISLLAPPSPRPRRSSRHHAVRDYSRAVAVRVVGLAACAVPCLPPARVGAAVRGTSDRATHARTRAGAGSATMASATTAHATGIAAGPSVGGGRRRRRTPERRPYWQFAVAASTSHCLAHTLTAPLKVVQISSQVRVQRSYGYHGASAAVLCGAVHGYGGVQWRRTVGDVCRADTCP